MKTSLILITKNEEKTIGSTLDSVISASLLPNEIIICDGLSTDKTVAVIKSYQKKVKIIKLMEEKSNRSQARNLAIAKSVGEILILTDSGCRADKNWFAKMTAPFADVTVDIVSGFYLPIIKNNLDWLVYLYTSIKPLDLDKDFLPSHRSVAYRKKAWQAIGGYNPKMFSSEDLMFNFQAKKRGLNFCTVRDAIVYWEPRGRNQSIFRQFFVMADSSARFDIVRSSVKDIFVRFALALFLLVAKAYFALILFAAIFIIWLSKKRLHDLQNFRQFLLLPFFHLLIDLAVISGTIWGIIVLKSQNIWRKES